MSLYPVTGGDLFTNVFVAPNGVSVAAGALGLRVNSRSWSTSGSQFSEPILAYTDMVITPKIQSVLQYLLGSGCHLSVALGKFLMMDPMTLSLIVNQFMQGISGKNASIICQQLQRATDVQMVLRDKQVHEYQKQINKAVEQSEIAHKAAIVGTMFDWIISGVEMAIGALRIMAGDTVGGCALFLAGLAGRIKAGAETAMLLEADKDQCNKVILGASIAQVGCEFIAMGVNIANPGQLAESTSTIHYIECAMAITSSVKDLHSGSLSMIVAGLQREIDGLITDQSFINYMQNWLEARKKTQFEQLQDTIQYSTQARKSVSQIIDNYGSVLENVVSGRA